jgi:plastocyanin
MRTGIIIIVVFAVAAAIGVTRAHSDALPLTAPTAALAPTPTPAPNTNVVLMQQGADGRAHFVPPTLTIHAGQKVTFYDNNAYPHSATADDGSFDTGVLSPGQPKSITFKKPGTYPYSDEFNSAMTGVIRVLP